MARIHLSPVFWLAVIQTYFFSYVTGKRGLWHDKTKKCHFIHFVILTIRYFPPLHIVAIWKQFTNYAPSQILNTIALIDQHYKETSADSSTKNGVWTTPLITCCTYMTCPNLMSFAYILHETYPNVCRCLHK